MKPNNNNTKTHVITRMLRFNNLNYFHNDIKLSLILNQIIFYGLISITVILKTFLFDFFVGVEALETAISYWEDALAAYQSGGGSAGDKNPAVLLGLEDSTFCRELQELLEAGYQLQEQSEMLFLDQRSALFGGDKVKSF